MILFLITACSSDQSLQEYFVENSENSNFMSFDVPTSVLNLKNAQLSSSEKDAINSLRKLNILAFKKKANNLNDYTIESEKIKAILKNDKYTDLMSFKTGFGNASIKYLGEEDAIDEVIVFGDNKDKGFAVVRVLGDDINPASIATLMTTIQKSNYKGEGFSKLSELFK